MKSKKTVREERKVAMINVLAEEVMGGGEGGCKSTSYDVKK